MNSLNRLYFFILVLGFVLEWLLNINTVVASQWTKPTGELLPQIRDSMASQEQLMANDLLLSFQWPLRSQGQEMIFPNGTYIDSELVRAVTGADLGASIIDEIESKVKRDLVIAVLDFGVDYNHEDIVNNIAYNPIECDKGPSGNYKNPFRPQEDRDGNGYKGDCIGWNFMSGNRLGEDNNPMDKSGHGTHIAGIMAAEKNNYIGISGLSNRVKILPVRIWSRQKEEVSRALEGGKSLTDRVINGVRYAMLRGVDAINFSLGWPSGLDSKAVQEVVQEAIGKGIIVVAAAGNNNNSRPIAPCKYPGVICVGSFRADKKVSLSSNFGIHVDIVAPGDHILSLFPTSVHNKYQANVFNLPGYEVKSGTSQAAPYITGLSVLLKNSLGIDSDETKARLFMSAEELLDERKYFRDGRVHLERAYRVAPQAMLRPELKGLDLIVVDSQSGFFQFPLEVKNYWKKSQDFNIQVRSLSSHITVDKSDFDLKSIEKGGSHVVYVKGKVDLKRASRMAKWSLRLTHGGEGRDYPFETVFAQNLEGQKGLQKVFIDGDDEINKTLASSQRLVPIQTIIDLKNSSMKPEYYWESRDKGKNKLKVLQWVGDRYQVTKEINLSCSSHGFSIRALCRSVEKVEKLLLLSFHRDDFEGDGVAEYIIRMGYEIEYEKDGLQKKETIVQYIFLDHLFNPYYFPHHSSWEFNVTENNSLIFEQRLDKLQFLPFESSVSEWGRDKVWVPSFVQLSFLSPVDENPSDFSSTAPNRHSHLNFLIPHVSDSGHVVMKQRVFFSHKRRGLIAEQLNQTWKSHAYILSLLSQPLSWATQSIQAFMGVSGESSTDYYVVTLSGKALPSPTDWDFIKYHIEPLQDKLGHGEVFNFDFNQVSSSIAIDGDSYQMGHSDIFFAPFNEQMVRVAQLDRETISINKKSIVKQKDLSETIHRFVQSFSLDDTLYTILESNNFLILLSTQGYNETKVSQVPLTRFSFLPGYLRQEIVQPIVVRDDRVRKPALYVDSSYITSHHVYSWVVDEEGHLTSPLDLSISLPNNCRTQNISSWGQGQDFVYVFLCSNEDKDRWWFHFLPAVRNERN